MNTLPDSLDHPISPDGPRRPKLLIFDVNETLSDLSALPQRFEDVGAPGHLAAVWFAGLLRDGFALTAAGSTAPFASVGAESLRVLLAGVPLNQGVAQAVQYVMTGFSELDVHPDVPDGIRALAQLGVRMVSLSNGSVEVARKLFDRADVTSCFERLLSVEDAGVWKPAVGAYAYAVAECHADLIDTMLVASHPWDIHGANKAGLATAWLNRGDSHFPDYFEAATVEARSLTHLAELLA